MSTLDDTTDFALDRNSPFIGNIHDIPMIIAQVLICCSLCVGTPLQFVALRTALYEQIFPDPKYTTTR